MRWSSLRFAVVALALGAGHGAQASEVETGEDSLQGMIEKVRLHWHRRLMHRRYRSGPTVSFLLMWTVIYRTDGQSLSALNAS